MGFKALPIQTCNECPKAENWSSGGHVCSAMTPGRRVAEGPAKKAQPIPKWCPLPTVEYADED